MSLKTFLERENTWAQLMKRQPLTLATPAERQQIADRIDSQLSPENLTCDGELSRAQVNARYRQLTLAARQLLALDPLIKFSEYSEY
jgi:hypothetical protein